MKKEINKKLKLDNIDWAEVIDALGVREFESFTDSDIKRALKKTGRNFNNNGPFHSTVRDFLKTLGNTADTKLVRGEKIYTIISLKDAYEKTGRRQRKTVDSKPVVILSGPKEEKVVKIEEPEENKIKDLFKNKYTFLQSTLSIVAIFIKHGETEISGIDVRADYESLGYKWNTYISFGRAVTQKILRQLGYGDLEIKREYQNSTWKLKTNIDILDVYMKLSEIYEKLSGEKPRDLDEFISSKEKPVEQQVISEDKTLWKVKKPKTPEFIPREESAQAKWEKWLLIEAIRSYSGATTKISSLVEWIKTHRHEEISEKKASQHLRELQMDCEGSITFHPGEKVSLDYKTEKLMCKQYDPRKLEEKIYVKLRLTPEELQQNFQDISFKVDEIIGDGKYLYEMTINRSYSSEICLKKLMIFIRIFGKIYSDNSFMVNRVKKILDLEEQKASTTKNILRNYENF